MDLIDFAASILVALLILLLIRELVCWYWKINKQVQQSDEIINLLKQINSEIQNLSFSVDSNSSWRNDDE